MMGALIPTLYPAGVSMNRPLPLSCALGLVLSLVVGSALHAETSAERDARMKWWRDARLGMFIHWGLYAAPAGEWQGKEIPGIGEWIMNSADIPVAEYEQLTKQFNPTAYDPKAWA